MASDSGDTKAQEEQAARAWSPRDVGLNALAAVGTGIGVLGFVTLVGGAVLYAQMSAVGLPSGEIVARIPQSTMLVVGARLLVPLLAGLLLALLILRVLESGIEEQAKRQPSDASAAAYRKRQIKRLRGGACALLFAVGLAFAVIDIGKANGPAWLYFAAVFVLLVLVAVTYTVGVRTGRRAESVPSFGVFAAVSTVVTSSFLIVLGTTLASLAPAVRGVAVLRNDGSVVAGIYATANSSDVFVGEICEARGGALRGTKRSGALIVIPRSDIRTIFVSTTASLPGVLSRQSTLSEQLRSTVRRKPQGQPTYSTSGGQCTSELARTLDEQPLKGVPGVLQGP